MVSIIIIIIISRSSVCTDYTIGTSVLYEKYYQRNSQARIEVPMALSEDRQDARGGRARTRLRPLWRTTLALSCPLVLREGPETVRTLLEASF